MAKPDISKAEYTQSTQEALKGTLQWTGIHNPLPGKRAQQLVTISPSSTGKKLLGWPNINIYYFLAGQWHHQGGFGCGDESGRGNEEKQYCTLVQARGDDRQFEVVTVWQLEWTAFCPRTPLSTLYSETCTGRWRSSLVRMKITQITLSTWILGKARPLLRLALENCEREVDFQFRARCPSCARLLTGGPHNLHPQRPSPMHSVLIFCS